jgi:hypothetical protein
MTAVRSRGGDGLATAACDDLLRLVGDVDECKVFDILALRPTVAEIGQAALWALAKGGHPLIGTAAEGSMSLPPTRKKNRRQSGSTRTVPVPFMTRWRDAP